MSECPIKQPCGRSTRFFPLKSQGHIRLSQRSLATMMGSAWNGTRDATWHKDCRLTVLNSEPNICRGDKGGRKETKGHCCVQNLHFCFITSFAADNIYFGTSKSPQNLHYLYTLPTRQNLHNQFCNGQNLNWHKQVPAESTSPVLLRTESTLDEASNPAESALPVLQRTTSTLAQANPGLPSNVQVYRQISRFPVKFPGFPWNFQVSSLIFMFPVKGQTFHVKIKIWMSRPKFGC